MGLGCNDPEEGQSFVPGHGGERKRWRAEEQAPIMHKEVGVELTNFADLTVSGYIYKYPWKSKVGTYSQNPRFKARLWMWRGWSYCKMTAIWKKKRCVCVFFFLCITHLFLNLYFQGKIDIHWKAKILTVRFLMTRYIFVNNTPVKINYILSTQRVPTFPFKVNPLHHLKTTTSLVFIHILHLSGASFLNNWVFFLWI